MIQKPVATIIDILVGQEVAHNIALEINTNCTVLNTSMVRKLKHFKKVHVGISIDAYGEFHDYIRYPSRWGNVETNLKKLLELPRDKVTVSAVSILHAYNALNISELLRFLASMKVDSFIELATCPWFLGLDVIPPRARGLAARRLRRFAESDHPAINRSRVRSMAETVESLSDNCTPESLRTFMLFTNDLDATRGQNFSGLHSELLTIIEESGFHWTDELQFVKCRTLPS